MSPPRNFQQQHSPNSSRFGFPSLLASQIQPSIFNPGATKRSKPFPKPYSISQCCLRSVSTHQWRRKGLLANLGIAQYRLYSRWFSSSCWNICSLKWPIPPFRCQCPLENCFLMTKMAFTLISLPVDFLDNTTWNSLLDDQFIIYLSALDVKLLEGRSFAILPIFNTTTHLLEWPKWNKIKYQVVARM